MAAPTNIREQLMRDEGLRLKVYADSLGHPTIGYGRALDTNGISLAEAELLLTNDIAAVAANVFARIPGATSLDDARRGVLVNMAFNLGVDGLMGFHQTLAAVAAGQWEEAARHMLASHWAAQVGVRAERLAEQMRSGVWQ